MLLVLIVISHASILWADTISRCCFASVGIFDYKIRHLWDCLIFIILYWYDNLFILNVPQISWWNCYCFRCRSSGACFTNNSPPELHQMFNAMCLFTANFPICYDNTCNLGNFILRVIWSLYIQLLKITMLSKNLESFSETKMTVNVSFLGHHLFWVVWNHLTVQMVLMETMFYKFYNILDFGTQKQLICTQDSGNGDQNNPLMSV